MKIALIVQRCGAEVVGGSEALARQYAQSLRRFGAVEILTTCALEHWTWANHYPAGVTELDGVLVRRFANDFERGPYWSELCRLYSGAIDPQVFSSSPALKQAHAQRLARWPAALQEETVRWQGPYSSALFAYLERHRRAYDAFLFFAYLFPTTYFGMPCVPRARTLFCPTLHDEPIAYLPIFGRLFRRPRRILFLSESERALARRLYGGDGADDVVGMAVCKPEQVGPLPPGTPARYVLYAGRLEGGKGIDSLLEYFLVYKRRQPSDLKLVLIGTAGATLPSHPDVVYLGFVSEAAKFALLRGAQVFLHPSPFESFAIVLLESFCMGVPALVNGATDVLQEHCQQSGAGLSYRSAEEFCQHLQVLLADEERRSQMGARGRRYVEEKFRQAVVTEKLGRALSR